MDAWTCLIGTCRRLQTRTICSPADRAFCRDITGWTFADNADTTGMFSGADTWLSRASRDDTVNTTDGPPGAWVFNPCLENERVENGLCAPCSGGGTRAAGDDPALGVDTGCTFPDRAALKTAVDNCIAVDPTGVACCSHGADCGAAGTVEMPDWDVSLVTSMSELFMSKGSFNADISRWDVSSVTTMYWMFFVMPTRSTKISAMGYLARHDHAADVPIRRCVQSGYRGWDTSKVTTMAYMFRTASPRSTRTSGCGTPRKSRSGHAYSTTTAAQPMPG